MRSFDVATFVAFGAAHLGVAGNDVLMEFDYPEIYAPVDLGIGHCRLAVAEPAEMVGAGRSRRAGAMSASPPSIPRSTRRHFAARGVQAECIKLNGAMELAPTLGLCQRIVDLVSTGRTLKANGLVEVERIADVTSRLIVNRAALKTRPDELGALGRALPRARWRTAMPLRLDSRAGDFAERLRRLRSTRSRGGDEDVDRGRGRDHRRRARARAMRRSSSCTERFDRVKLTPAMLRLQAADVAEVAHRAVRRRSRRCGSPPSASKTFHARQLPDDVDYHRRRRHRAGLALDAARLGRALRAGRHGGLSLARC